MIKLGSSKIVIDHIGFKTKDGQTDTAARRTALEKNKISAIVAVKKITDAAGKEQYVIFDTLTNASGNAITALQQIFGNMKNTIAIKNAVQKPLPAVVPYVYSIQRKKKKSIP